jgi:hypothetical protein
VREGPKEVGTVAYRTTAFQVICSLHYAAIERKVVSFNVLFPIGGYAVDIRTELSATNRSSRSPSS